MKKFLFPAFLLMVLSLSSCENRKKISISFTNPITLDREDEVVEISADEFAAAAGEIPSGMVPLFLEDGDTLTSQCIDHDQDDVIDEILVQISLAGKETRDVSVVYLPEDEFPDFKMKTNIHFAYTDDPTAELDTASRVQATTTGPAATIYQMEGPAWENDKVGFRNYFDLRNGNDIFGKLTNEMVLDEVGTGEESYHDLHDWGMDILKVGNSLGAGSVALFMNDSLYRIGDNGFGRFKRLYEGPLRSAFRFDFPRWKAGGKSFDVHNYINITAGKYYYKSSLDLKENDVNAAFATGIVNKHSNYMETRKISNKYVALVSNGMQSEDSAWLAMGLLVPEDIYIGYNETPADGEGVTETYYVKMEDRQAGLSEYYFYAFWSTRNPEFEDTANVMDIIRRDALMLENPVLLGGNKK